MARDRSQFSGIAVRGFKSLRDEQRVEIRPLTILAGANSSGKSSIMQPLLLLKQTLDAPGDPGALLLDGPNVRFTSADQLLSRTAGTAAASAFAIRLDLSTGESLETVFRAEQGKGFGVERTRFDSDGDHVEITMETTHEEILGFLPKRIREVAERFARGGKEGQRYSVYRDRCFLALRLAEPEEAGTRGLFRPLGISPSGAFVSHIRAVIHLPGLRGNPRRTYPKTAVGPRFPGTFEAYVASTIARWEAEEKEKLADLGRMLQNLELSWKVKTSRVDDTQVEILVGRLPHSKRGGAHDLVNIADVGFGVSQSLPVLVALIEAVPGQLVYIEQPEIHLHPKAQRGLAHALCEAAKRGVVLVIETHSAILLRAIQTLVASGDMPREDVRLHWFQRDEAGVTIISTGDLDEDGAYGDWPQDFDITELEVERAYLDTIEAKGKTR